MSEFPEKQVPLSSGMLLSAQPCRTFSCFLRLSHDGLTGTYAACFFWPVRNLVKFLAASPSGGSSRSARRRTSPACPTTWRCSTASYRLGNQLFSNTTCAWAHFTSFVFLQNRSLFYLSLMFIRVHNSESIDPCRLAGLDILKQAHVTMLVCIPLIFLQHGGGCK